MFDWMTRIFSAPNQETPSRAGERMLGQKPRQDAEACKNRGNAHLAKGEVAAAFDCYQQAIAIDPSYAQAYNNLGLVLLQQGEAEEAMTLFRRALSLEPDLAQAHLNCGNIHKSKGQLDEALVSFRKALSINPQMPDAHNNIGVLLQERGRPADALASYQAAIRFNPDFVDAHYNLGDLLEEQGRLDNAAACFQKAIQLKPEFAEAHNSLGIVCKEQGQLDQALACFETALALKPNFPKAHNNLGSLALYKGQQDAAYLCFRRALQLDPNYAEAHSNFLFAAQYDARYSSADLFAEHLQFGERFETPLRSQWPAHKNSREPDRRLRIGFVSGDLRTHPVGFFMENVLTHLDPQLLDVTLYPTQAKCDAVSLRLQGLGFAWRSLAGLSDDQAARRIADDGIDILMDLSGHTAYNRLLLFARKPAPIQVSWLYFSSTGLRAIDYLLCDRHVVPSAEAEHFVEKPWYLPDSYLCFTPPQDEVPVEPLPALENGCVTFGCFNNLTKMNDTVVRLWAQMLRAVPDSRLFLKASQLNDASVRRTTQERFAADGIAPDRLMLEGSSSRVEYLSCYNRVDIALDPFPFPGGTTTVEALWMGVPVLNRRGNRFISHAGESILQTAGLPDWIARDDEDYIAKARRFAADRLGLAMLRASLRSQFLASPVCDAPRFARNLETAFRQMWLAFVGAASL